MLVLSAEQDALFCRFAPKGKGEFGGLDLDEDDSKASPLDSKASPLKDCAAGFQCRTAFSYDCGDQSIFVGEVLAYDRSDLPPLVFHGGPYTVAARKPREELRLAASPVLERRYVEELLGHLRRRTPYRIPYALRQLLCTQAPDRRSFYRSETDEGGGVQCIHRLRGKRATRESMATLDPQALIAVEASRHTEHYVLTANGQEESLRQIALARAVEDDMSGRLGSGDTMTLKFPLNRMIASSDPYIPDLWSPR